MSATVLLDQAVAFIRASLTKQQAVTVKRYAGEFNGAEMKHVSYVCPAVLLTVLGWKAADAGGRMTGRHTRSVRLAAFVVCKNAKDRESRMAEAMALAENVSVLLLQWAPMAQQPYAAALTALDITASGLSDEPSCENLYNRAVDEQGQALWLVDWYQTVKGSIPIGPGRPAVPYDQLPNLVAVAIEDTTHVAQGPVTVELPQTPITVTEKVSFTNP